MRRICTTNKGHALGVRVGISDKSGYRAACWFLAVTRQKITVTITVTRPKIRDTFPHLRVTLPKLRVAFPKIKAPFLENKGHPFRKI